MYKKNNYITYIIGLILVLLLFIVLYGSAIIQIIKERLPFNVERIVTLFINLPLILFCIRMAYRLLLAHGLVSIEDEKLIQINWKKHKKIEYHNLTCIKNSLYFVKLISRDTIITLLKGDNLELLTSFLHMQKFPERTGKNINITLPYIIHLQKGKDAKKINSIFLFFLIIFCIIFWIFILWYFHNSHDWTAIYSNSILTTFLGISYILFIKVQFKTISIEQDKLKLKNGFKNKEQTYSLKRIIKFEKSLTQLDLSPCLVLYLRNRKRGIYKITITEETINSDLNTIYDAIHDLYIRAKG